MPHRLLTVWLLAFALVGAQALGLAHRVLHGHAPVAVALAGDELFSGHGDGEVSCPLYDQLSGPAIAPAIPALCVPALPPTFLIAFAQGEALARWAALYDARGPPALR